MKKILFSLLLSFVAWQTARAQVVVEVTLEQEQFLPGESMPAAIRVSNRSGRTLALGGEADWLTFSIQSREGALVSRNGEVPVVGAFSLDSASVATKRVNLAPYFSLTKPGHYFVTATVRLKEWDGTANSPPKAFDVIDGTKIWSQEFGVPVIGDATNQPPEVRHYALLQANYLRSELRLYFRLTDASDAKVMKVFALGQIVSFARPDAEVDGQSRLHVLHQNGARTSIYTVVTPDGDIAVRQLYEFGNARPQLRADDSGKISVAGGIRRTTSGDIPAKKIEDESKPAKP
jgi:hypothetical protein